MFPEFFESKKNPRYRFRVTRVDFTEGKVYGIDYSADGASEPRYTWRHIQEFEDAYVVLGPRSTRKPF